MIDNSQSIRQALKRAVVLFRKGAYLEFQEAIEALYPGADESGRFLCESLVELALGMRLFLEFGSERRGENALRQALLKLEFLPAVYKGLRVEALREDIGTLLKTRPEERERALKIRFAFFG